MGYIKPASPVTHVYYVKGLQSQGSGTAIVNLLRRFHPKLQSLRMIDIAHHHLAIKLKFLIPVAQIEPTSGLSKVILT